MPTTYLRYRQGEQRRTPRSRYGPLTFDHPLTGRRCAECGGPLRAGDRPSLFAVGPADPETAELADAGLWYNAVALPMHETCAYPDPEHEH